MSHDCSNRSIATPEHTSLFAYPFIFAIYLYRFTLSPFIGRSCRFYPTCSHYAEDALRKYGAMRGLGLAIKRIAKCHPWHEGGFDPVN